MFGSVSLLGGGVQFLGPFFVVVYLGWPRSVLVG